MLDTSLDIDITSRYFEELLNSGKLTPHQLSARRFRARKANDIDLCLQLAIAAELHLLHNKLTKEEV